MSEVGGWTKRSDSVVVSCRILPGFGFSFFFFSSKTVWRYRDGLINLVEESYIFLLSQTEYGIFLWLLRFYYDKIGVVFISV